eukprot:Amastigsp_a339417_404.p3 type:complete len:105 gc:universal Amastigsp_a339417_404:386-700(+)
MYLVPVMLSRPSFLCSNRAVSSCSTSTKAEPWRPLVWILEPLPSISAFKLFFAKFLRSRAAIRIWGCVSTASPQTPAWRCCAPPPRLLSRRRPNRVRSRCCCKS